MASKPRPASLTGLTVPKGQAAPVTVATPAPSQTSAPAIQQQENESVKQRAITVKLDPERYRTLQLEKIDSGLSHQDIMVAAFDAFMRLPSGDRYKKVRK